MARRPLAGKSDLIAKKIGEIVKIPSPSKLDDGFPTPVRGKTPNSAPDAPPPPRKPVRNERLANTTHPKTGVPFDADGFPNFAAHKHPDVPDVTIDAGYKPRRRAKDERMANEAAGLSETPQGYTWHHHQDTGRMQLVDYKVHRDTGHTGGFTLWG